MTLVLLLIPWGRTSGGHGLLEAVPRIYQVTPDIPDRRRATQQDGSQTTDLADSLKESQLAARSGPSPPRRTSPTTRITTASLRAAAVGRRTPDRPTSARKQAPDESMSLGPRREAFSEPVHDQRGAGVRCRRGRIHGDVVVPEAVRQPVVPPRGADGPVAAILLALHDDQQRIMHSDPEHSRPRQRPLQPHGLLAYHPDIIDHLIEPCLDT